MTRGGSQLGLPKTHAEVLRCASQEAPVDLLFLKSKLDLSFLDSKNCTQSLIKLLNFKYNNV